MENSCDSNLVQRHDWFRCSFQCVNYGKILTFNLDSLLCFLDHTILMSSSKTCVSVALNVLEDRIISKNKLSSNIHQESPTNWSLCNKIKVMWYPKCGIWTLNLEMLNFNAIMLWGSSYSKLIFSTHINLAWDTNPFNCFLWILCKNWMFDVWEKSTTPPTGKLSLKQNKQPSSTLVNLWILSDFQLHAQSLHKGWSKLIINVFWQICSN